MKASMQKMAETNTTTSGSISDLTELLRNANLPAIITQLDAFQTSLNTLSSYLQDRIIVVENTQVSMQVDISSIKGMVTFLPPPPQDTKPILVTIVRPTTKPTLEVKLIGSLSQPTSPVIDITPPEQSIHEEQPKIQYTIPKPNRGKGIARDINESP
ncbi:hypothetical protein Tco_1148270 [Tanacetum coccineum]